MIEILLQETLNIPQEALFRSIKKLMVKWVNRNLLLITDDLRLEVAEKSGQVDIPIMTTCGPGWGRTFVPDATILFQGKKVGIIQVVEREKLTDVVILAVDVKAKDLPGIHELMDYLSSGIRKMNEGGMGIGKERRRPGRHYNEIDLWAWKEIHESGNPEDDVHNQWMERIPKIRFSTDQSRERRWKTIKIKSWYKRGG
jgi:hypothetical protein